MAGTGSTRKDSDQEKLKQAFERYHAGDWQSVVGICSDLTEYSPHLAVAWHLRGLALLRQGKAVQAVELISQAIALDDTQAHFHNHLGAAWEAIGCDAEALTSFQRAVQINPAYVEAHINCATIWERQGEWALVESALCRARSLAPQNEDLLCKWARLLFATSRQQQAITMLREAVAKTSHSVGLNKELARLLIHVDDFAGAVNVCQELVKLQANDAGLWVCLGQVLGQLGQIDEANQAFEQALTICPDKSIWRLRQRLMSPAVFDSAEEIEQFQNQLQQTLCDDSFARLAGAFDQLLAADVHPPFAVNFQGRKTRAVKERLAVIVRGAQPGEKPPPRTDKPRIGFVVTQGHEGLFCRCTGGIVERLDREEFDVVVLASASCLPRLRQELASEISFIALPASYSAASAAARQADCDLLYHWEVGSDAWNYLLPMAQAARVQCTSWGTQVTSGLKEIDYYLSSRWIERPHADDDYTERLVRLETLPTWQRRVSLPPPTEKSYFGWSSAQHIYLCPQNLLKIHPDQDALFADILRTDSAAVIVLKQTRSPAIAEQLQARFARRLGTMAQRIVMLPWLSTSDYYRLISVADVVLDPVHYSAGSSCYDMLSLHQPIVTLPGELNVGRFTQACYRKIGLNVLIATNAQEYVRIATRVAQDANFRTHVCEQLRERGDVLLEDQSAVSAHADFFGDAIAKARQSR